MVAAAPLVAPEQVRIGNTQESARIAPTHAWTPCDADELAALLAQGGWSLVEFWTPASLFSRLLAPVRLGLTATHSVRLRLLCCTDDVFNDRFVAFGATGLPAILLFQGRRRVRRWLGATDLSLVRFELDAALSDAHA